MTWVGSVQGEHRAGSRGLAPNQLETKKRIEMKNLKSGSIQAKDWRKTMGKWLENVKVAQRPCENHEGISKGMLAASARGRCGGRRGVRVELSGEQPGLGGLSVETTLC